MVARPIEIEPECDIARLLLQARKHPIVVKLDGERFRVRLETAVEEHDDSTYGPQRAIQGMNEAQGVITPQEAEEWIENVYRWRREGSRAMDEPCPTSSTPIGSSADSVESPKRLDSSLDVAAGVVGLTAVVLRETVDYVHSLPTRAILAVVGV